MKTLFTPTEWEKAKTYPGLIKMPAKRRGHWIQSYIFRLRDMGYPRIHFEVCEKTIDFITISFHIDWTKHDYSTSEDIIIRNFVKKLKSYAQGEDNGHK